MIFKKTWQQVLDGTKTQTRRIVKPNQHPTFDAIGNIIIVWNFTGILGSVRRVLWRLGCERAIQPGRGIKAVGRVRITKVRLERLQEISLDDCLAEGIRRDIPHKKFPLDDCFYRSGTDYPYGSAKEAFKGLWDSLHRRPYHWEDNPEVWVLEFERVKKEKNNGAS